MPPEIRNRRAFRDYEIIETYEAGIRLQGSEVKSVRAGKVSLDGSFARIENGQIYLNGVEISPYANAGYAGHQPDRPRKLLLHRREIDRIAGQVSQKGLTLVPLRMYFRRGWAKVELAVARGKTHEDKRETLKRRQIQREIDQEIKRRS